MDASFDVHVEVIQRQGGVYVATTPIFPDMRAEDDSSEGAAAELMVKVRDRVVRETGASRGVLGPLLRIDRDQRD